MNKEDSKLNRLQGTIKSVEESKSKMKEFEEIKNDAKASLQIFVKTDPVTELPMVTVELIGEKVNLVKMFRLYLQQENKIYKDLLTMVAFVKLAQYGETDEDYIAKTSSVEHHLALTQIKLKELINKCKFEDENQLEVAMHSGLGAHNQNLLMCLTPENEDVAVLLQGVQEAFLLAMFIEIMRNDEFFKLVDISVSYLISKMEYPMPDPMEMMRVLMMRKLSRGE